MLARVAMRYQAFLSYSHAADGQLAPALQSGLHRFARPWYKLRAVRVFRDQTTLAVTPELWPAIAGALDESEHLILMASPKAAESEWVQRELVHWLRVKERASRLLIALTEGEIVRTASDFDWNATTALPRLLAGAFPTDPLYVDLRWARSSEDLSLRNVRFADAIATFAARLHGRDKDELIGEDVRQHRRTMMVAGAAAATIVAAGSVAVWQAEVANRERAEAERQRTISVARQLSARAELLWQRQGAQLEPALLLAAESVRRQPTPEAISTLTRGLALVPASFRKWELVASAAALHPGGNLVAVAVEGSGRITLFSAASNRKVGEIPLQLNSPRLSFSPDGSYLMTTGLRTGRELTTNGLSVWNLRAGRLIVDASYPVLAIGGSFSPDGRFAVAHWSRWDGTKFHHLSEVFDLGTGEPLPTSDPRLERIVLSTPGRNLIFDRASELSARIPGLAEEIRSHTPLALDEKRWRLAVADDRGRINVWDLTEDRLLWRQEARAVNDLQFVSFGDSLVSVGSLGIRFWNATTGAELCRVPQTGAFPSAAFSKDGKRLLVWSFREGLRLWDLAVLHQGIWEQEPEWMGDAQLSADGRIVLGGRDNEILLRDAATGREVNRLLASNRWDDSALDLHGERIARAEPFLVRVWDAKTGAELPSHTARIVTALGFGGPYLAVANGDPLTLGNVSVDILPVRGGAAVRRFRHPEVVETVALPPSGKRLAALSADGRGWVADLTSRRLLALLPAEVQGDPPLAFSPDENLLAFAAEDRQAQVLDLTTGRLVASLPHPNVVRKLAFSRDGKLLVTVTVVAAAEKPDPIAGSPMEGHTVTVWKLPEGEPLARFEAERPLLDIRFRNDRETLVTLDDLGWVRSFQWDPDELRREVCDRLGRNLTVTEWREGFGDGEPVPATCFPISASGRGF